MSILHVILLAIATMSSPPPRPAAPLHLGSQRNVILRYSEGSGLSRRDSSEYFNTTLAHSSSAEVDLPKPAPTTPPPPPASQPTMEFPTGVAFLVGVVLIGFGLLGAYLAGVFSRDRGGLIAGISGPIRLPSDAPALPILIILLIAGGCWLGGQMLYFAIRAAQHMHATGERNFSAEHLGPADLAVVATVPALVAMLITLAADNATGLLRAIGIRLSQLPRMLLVGLLSGVIGLLLVFGASYIVGVIYELIHFQHPSEHELLGAMKDASPIAKLALVIGACVIAPLFEELLFRGHLQTLLVRLFTRRPTPLPAPVPVAPALATETGTAANLDAPLTLPPSQMPVPVMDYSNPAPGPDSTAARWLAVIVTALVFALVHPLWTAPLIFLLAVCLGYAYERTGSIWVPITMHAMFNISSTFLFLNFM